MFLLLPHIINSEEPVEGGCNTPPCTPEHVVNFSQPVAHPNLTDPRLGCM